ncbi:MAG: ABC transporter permease, partial [Clostridia bacterium]|nr:ABC transporter permease [Clostridia bacterium]
MTALVEALVALSLSENAVDELLAAYTTAELAAMFDETYENMTDEQKLMLYAEYMPALVSDTVYDKRTVDLGFVDPDSPASISIYVKDFASKDVVTEFIASYNKSVDEHKQIDYTDLIGIMLSSVTAIINAISYVLIAFVSISLVVSSIMIGIITYISVLERTKEIGILRAIGASKRDISRVFNAETLIVGFCAGAIGIISTVLLCFPINAIIHYYSGIEAINAFLPAAGGVFLMIISMLLTFVAGLFPSRIAAKKDPVKALRTE